MADEEMIDAEPTPTAHGMGSAPTAEKWFTHPTEALFANGQTIAPNQKYHRTAYNMYCNSTMYCFMRLFGILYERLIKVKANEEEVHKTIRRALHPKAARELHWIEKTPQNFFADTTPQANYYNQMVWMFNEMAKGNAEMSQLEETLRRYYLQDGWQLYSLDKLLGSLTRFAVGMVTPDSREKTTEIYHLFKKDRQRGSETSHQDELNYRRQVDKHIKDGDVFRIAYVSYQHIPKVITMNAH
jgi:paired amphipathic helix protein Sin3a